VQVTRCHDSIGCEPTHALVMLGKQTKPTIDLKGTASGPVCLAYEILSLVPPSVCVCLSVSLLPLSRARERSCRLLCAQVRSFCRRRPSRFQQADARILQSLTRDS